MKGSENRDMDGEMPMSRNLGCLEVEEEWSKQARYEDSIQARKSHHGMHDTQAM
jgi:hypothetical protein